MKSGTSGEALAVELETPGFFAVALQRTLGGGLLAAQ
jgi:hypothetical protein